MVQAVWQFVVKEEAVDRFEQAYGPDGEWARLFARYPGFLGTTLARDTANPRRFMTIDAWESSTHRQRMLDEATAEYTELDARFEGWTESETELGVFEI